jgi:hypothetical protein
MIGYSQWTDSIYNNSGYLKIKNNPDSIVFSKDYFFNEGIYLTHHDFRTGNAIPRSFVLTSIEKNQLDFFSKLVERQDTLVVRNGIGIKIVLSDSVFCFVQNNVVYMNVEGSFCRIPVFGNISHFIGTISVKTLNQPGNFYDPYTVSGGSSITGVSGRTKETRELLFDFYTGEISLADTKQMEELIRDDNELSAEYRKLSRRQQRKKLNDFIKRYNARNEVKFPKY